MKISEAFELYKEDLLYFRRQNKSAMGNNKYHRAAAIQFFGDVDVEKLTSEDVRKWLRWLEKPKLDGTKRGQNTIRNYANSLRQVLQYCQSRGVNCIGKESVLCPPRKTTSVSYVTPDEVQLLIDTAQSIRAKFIISFLYASGVRLSEFLSLNRGDIRARSFRVIGKGDKERLCFIDARTEALMAKYMQSRADHNEALVVSGLYGARLSASTVQLIIRNVVERSGLQKRITPHTFRHGYATDLVKNGCDIRYVAQALGHSHLNNTMVYTHIANPDLASKYKKYHRF